MPRSSHFARTCRRASRTAGVEPLEPRRLCSGTPYFIATAGTGDYTGIVAGVGVRYRHLARVQAYPKAGGEIDRDPSHYHVSVDWDDPAGNDGEVVVVADQYLNGDPANKSFPIDIKGSHNYKTAGTYHVQITVGHDGATSQKFEATSFTVNYVAGPGGIDGPRTPAPKLAGVKPFGDVSVQLHPEGPFNSTTGQAISRPLAYADECYYDAKPDFDPADYKAQVDWGDGAGWANGAVVKGSSSTGRPVLLIKDTAHTYSKPGKYVVVANLTGPDGSTFHTRFGVNVTGAAVTPKPAAVSNGNINIQGSDGDDSILVTRLPDGRYQISGKIKGTSFSQAVSGNGIRRISASGGNGNDSIVIGPSVRIPANVDGGAGDDVIRGGAGNDYLRGGPGTDTIRGGDGNDQLFTGAGNGVDALYGEAGNDTLVGIGGGTDFISGGAGKDIFCIDAPTPGSSGDAHDPFGGDLVNRVPGFQRLRTPVTGQFPTREQDGESIIDPVSIKLAPQRNYSGRPLFGSSITLRDINQGEVGDCYFQAGIAAVAERNPDFIRRSVVDLGDGTYAVRFVDPEGTEQFVRVDGDLPVNSNGSLIYGQPGDNGCIWAAIMEKAWAFRRFGVGSYDALNVGTPMEVWDQLGVPDRKQTTVKLHGTTEMMDIVAKDVSARRAAAALSGVSTASDSKILANHVYVVAGALTDGGKVSGVLLYNPHGFDNTPPRAPQDSIPGDGFITLSPQEFMKNFAGYFSAKP